MTIKADKVEHPKGESRDDTVRPPLTPEAQRALAEAKARRQSVASNTSGAGEAPAKEVGGRGGLDPIRYGDWEKGGLISDF